MLFFVHNQILLRCLRLSRFSDISVTSVVLIKRWIITLWCVYSSWRSQGRRLLWCSDASTYCRKISHSCIDGARRGVNTYASRKYVEDIILNIIEWVFNTNVKTLLFLLPRTFYNRVLSLKFPTLSKHSLQQRWSAEFWTDAEWNSHVFFCVLIC